MRSFPFTGESYFSLFETYNDTIWPAQIVAYVLGIAGGASGAAADAGRRAHRAGGAGPFWLWNGIVYHLGVFPADQLCRARLCRAVHAAGSAAGGSAIRGRRQLRFGPTLSAGAGLAFALFALVVYPLLAWLAGHGWPRAAMFGVAPTPDDHLHVRRAADAGGRAPRPAGDHSPAVGACGRVPPALSGSARPRTGRSCSPALSASACWSGSAGRFGLTTAPCMLPAPVRRHEDALV